jgi:glycine hydroxymethyltransferase
MRIGVAELTRLGMKCHEMSEVAALYRRVIKDKESPTKVAADVTALREGFQDVHYGYRWEDI